MNSVLAPFSYKMDESMPGRFEGYGSTFGNVDLGKDICVKGCFVRSLGDHSKGGTLPAMYWMHDRSEPVGDWLEMSEDSKGLRVVGQLWTGDKETEASRKAANLLRGTSAKGLSIGYGTKKYAYDQKTGVRSLEDVDLFEVSVVGYGMNPKALVTHIKSLTDDGEIPAIRDVERLLRDAGLSASQAKAILSGGYKALQRDVDGDEIHDDMVDLIAKLRESIKAS